MGEAIGPLEVYPLAFFIHEELQAREWTVDDLALRMGPLSEYGMNHLMVDLMLSAHREKLIFKDEFLADVAHALGVSPAMLRHLDDQWRAWPDRRQDFEPDDAIFGSDRGHFREPS